MNYCPECSSQLVSRHIDNAEHLHCSGSQCKFVHWDNPVPVVMAVVLYENHYIIAHNVLWPKHIYSFITGYVDRHEHPEQAVVREVKEELGLSGKINRFLGHYMFKAKNQMVIAYEVVATGQVQLNQELDDFVVLTGEELALYDFGPLYVTSEVVIAWSKVMSNTVQ